MDLKATLVYEKLANAWLAKKRHIWVEGGTAASKTFSVIQLLILINGNAKSQLLTSCVSESMPHIKRGCLRDFRKIMGDGFSESRFNKTDFIYSFDKAKLEFFSADQPDKLRGARRDILFCNELNNFSYDAYRELDARTRLCTIADWNPTSEFFFHDNKLADDPDSCYIHATYKDALEVVSPDVIQNILKMGERDQNWARIYLEGLVGKLEGLVYPKFEQVDELPSGNNFYGLDYGFASDPTVLVKNVIVGENLYSQEMFYDYSGLTNDDIVREMRLCRVKGDEWIYADPDEPKSAEELRRLGFTVVAIDKAFANVAFGIKQVNSYNQYWTKDSLNCIKEQRNFRYIEDRQHPGRFTEKTTHQWSHGMSARRYAVASYVPEIVTVKMPVNYMSRRNYGKPVNYMSGGR